MVIANAFFKLKSIFLFVLRNMTGRFLKAYSDKPIIIMQFYSRGKINSCFEILIGSAKFKENVLIRVITVIKVCDLLNTLLQVITILRA